MTAEAQVATAPTNEVHVAGLALAPHVPSFDRQPNPSFAGTVDSSAVEELASQEDCPPNCSYCTCPETD